METNTTETSPHQDMSQAGYSGRVYMRSIGKSVWEAQGLLISWQEAKVLAQKRVQWRPMVDTLCSASKEAMGIKSNKPHNNIKIGRAHV